MDSYNRNYSRCRQFTPAGWGTARTLAPCGRSPNQSIAFRVTPTQCRPAYQPMIIPSQGGMNLAQDESIWDNPDPCHGRRFCPPQTQRPINVQLKMCPVTQNSCGQQQGNYGPGSGQGYGQQQQQVPRDPYCEQCPNTCPLPRCPPGVKVSRTYPIIPVSRIQENYFKMPNSSVYKSDYVPRELERTPSFAPERIVVESEGNFENQSLTRADYHPHPVCPYKKPPWSFAKPREENTMRLNGISTYKIDYVPKEGKPAHSAKPTPFLDADPPNMDDLTVYQVEYVAHPLEPPAAKLTKAQQLAEITSTCCPFDGLTIYKQDYIPKQVMPAQSVIDKERRYMRNLQPMDGTTTYKSSFNPFYFEDIECIPAEIYDQIYPPSKDSCRTVSCYPEGCDRNLENPIEPPRPPCPPAQERPYCPSPYEMQCSPRAQPCVSPYKLKQEGNNYDGSTTIRVEHNVNRECQNEPIEYICPQMPCKPTY